MFKTHTSLTDQVISQIDEALKTCFPPQNRVSDRENPGEHEACPELSRHEKKHTAGLMRVNHSGEVCAQALYQGQAQTARLENIRQQMQQSALEEVDHLAWCEKRLEELEDTTSILNPIWYGLSYMIGALAGALGDKWSLGFVVETEHQVAKHLDSHLTKINSSDKKTRAIIEQMKEDELSHAHHAKIAGGADLPEPVKYLMHLVAKMMTKTSYYI